jgi:ribosomal protein L7/L12
MHRRRAQAIEGNMTESIITDSETNAFQSRMPTSDEFRWLLHKYRVLVSQLYLASKDFGDLSDIPVEHIAGALVVQEASAELRALYDKFYEWYARQNDLMRGTAAPATEVASRSAPRVGLVLNEYAPDKKVDVIRVLRESVPGCSLSKAKSLVERELPAPIANGLPLEEAKVIRQKFEAIGAVCKISVMTS